jgi:hypothetical protein
MTHLVMIEVWNNVSGHQLKMLHVRLNLVGAVTNGQEIILHGSEMHIVATDWRPE